jgi:Protein kinase domain
MPIVLQSSHYPATGGWEGYSTPGVFRHEGKFEMFCDVFCQVGNHSVQAAIVHLRSDDGIRFVEVAGGRDGGGSGGMGGRIGAWPFRVDPASGDPAAAGNLVLLYNPFANRSPMTLTPGTRVGPYEVSAAIGAGGMGEVYRARDTRLNRDVAIKVLPDVFSSDPDRLGRFRREAQLLATLNHQNIAAIYGLEEAGIPPGTSALVLELVDGPTLADRIAAGPLPLEEALSIARQLVDALESAWESCIATSSRRT